MSLATTTDATALIEEFLPESPFVADLGIELMDIADGRGVLRLPFRPQIVTIGQTVHGGAIAALVDTAAMVAAWAGAEIPDELRGATVELSVSYLAPADGEDVTAEATVVRRGRRLVTVRVDAHADGHVGGGTHVATALVTYQLG